MKQFICEEIKAGFAEEFILEKNPPCPKFIIWRDEIIGIDRLLSSWFDYTRKGDRSRNLRPTHLNRAEVTGSWGVGRIYFKVLDANGRILVVYYDRAPRNAFVRKGIWVLLSMEND